MQYAAACSRREDVAASVFSVLGVYMRYPAAVFCFGLSAAGILLVPLAILLQGFGVAFSLACFVMALGSNGLLLALIAFGLRAMLVLPVTLFLSMDSLRSSLRILQNGKKVSGTKHHLDNGSYARLFLCLLLLLIGSAAELLIIPGLLKLVLARL